MNTPAQTRADGARRIDGNPILMSAQVCPEGEVAPGLDPLQLSWELAGWARTTLARDLRHISRGKAVDEWMALGLLAGAGELLELLAGVTDDYDLAVECHEIVHTISESLGVRTACYAWEAVDEPVLATAQAA